MSSPASALRANVDAYVGGFRDDSCRNPVGQRFAAEADRIARAYRAGDVEAAKRAVTDEMVDALGIVGTPADARAGLDRLRARSVVDEVVLSVPHAVALEDAIGTIEHLAPASN